jgi:hypothetical protein
MTVKLVRIATVVFFVALSGCGGGSQTSSVPSVPQPASTANSGTTAHDTLRAPKAFFTASTAIRRPHAISDTTDDECSSSCFIQGQSTALGYFGIGAASTQTVTYTAPASQNGLTFSVNPVTSTVPPFNTTVTINSSTSATISNQLSFVLTATISGDCTHYYCGPITFTPYGIEVQCSMNNNHCPLFDIKDVNLNKVVSASPPPTTKTIVGKQASLTLEHVANTGTGTFNALSNVQWTIPGVAVKNYDRSGGVVTYIAPADLQAENATFYWTDGGTNNPSVTAKLVRTDGSEIADANVSASYLVQVPVSTASAPVRHTARVGSRLDYAGLWLSDGDASSTAAGINFTYNVTNTYTFGGNISGTQLINPSYTYDGSTSTPTGGQMWLDNLVDYEPAVAAGKSWTAIDAPGEGLTAANNTAAITGTFRMYLMYQAPAPSIWVTLRTVDWSWSAAAARTGGPNVNVWCLGGATGCPNRTTPSTPNATVATSTNLPVWNGSVLSNKTGRVPLQRSAQSIQRGLNTTPLYVPN